MANTMWGKGFTLIELMIVVAIVAILAAVVYPSYQSAVTKTKRAEARAALMQVMQQQERYYSQNSTYAAFSKTTPGGFKIYSGDGAASPYELSGAACANDTILNCVQLTATPIGSFTDAKCGNLGISSTGVKSPTTTGCW